MSTRARTLAGLILFGWSAGCLEAGPAHTATPIAPRDVSAPTGAGLERACTPSGMELCFNATDDNCNGVIDEGCGLHTGVLQFAVAWDTPGADVNLEVTDPTGEVVQPGEASAGGLFKDRDCPRDGALCFEQNVENVYSLGTKPESGRYRIAVKLERLGGASAPVTVRLGVRIGQQTHALRFELSPGEGTSEQALEFTL